MSMKIAIDTGGTFTDVVAIDDDNGRQYVIKTPSTPHDPSVGLLNGVTKVLNVAGKQLSDVGQLLHGSTTATNAVLEHKFEGLGLIVTKGFRHLIEIARQSVPDGYGNSLFWVKPPRLVPLHLVGEASGRMDFKGNELEPLDEASVMEQVDNLVEQGVTYMAVCLLHSYANDAHEVRIGELIARKHPQILVSLSSVVLPEYREYERAMTTLIDVLVKPYCKTYLQKAADKVREQAGDIPFLIMQSNGGVVKHETAGNKPVTMLLSGPAGGVLGAIHMSKLAEFNDILTIDVGGTSTDVSLVSDLKLQLTSHSLIESYPVKTPMLDIVTVGTGGGSLAWIDDYRNLKVGPKSSGAVPGPICYRRGGEVPTVTDAAVVMGRLPAALVGGDLKLDIESSKIAYGKLGDEYGMKAEEVAAGVFEIATANMVHGIRQVSTTRGRNPSNHVLVSYGGAGGLFATEVAYFLNMRSVLSPPNPGNLSAFGLHVCDVKQDFIRTMVCQQSLVDPAEIDQNWTELGQQGLAQILSEGVPAERITIARSADVRYVGEGYEVNVVIPLSLTGQEATNFMWDDFHRVHNETFGFHYQGIQDVELVNLRIQAVGEVQRPTDLKVIAASSGDSPEPSSRRPVYWREDGWVECDIYDRESFGSDQQVSGPAVIEEYGSTVVVPARWTVCCDRYGNLILEKR